MRSELKVIPAALFVAASLLLTGCYDPPLVDDQLSGSGPTINTDFDFGGRSPEQYFRQFTYRKDDAAKLSYYLTGDWTMLRRADGTELYHRGALALMQNGDYTLIYQEATGDLRADGLADVVMYHSQPYTGKWSVADKQLVLDGVANAAAYRVDGREAVKMRLGRDLHTAGTRGQDLVLEFGGYAVSLDDLKKNVADQPESAWLRSGTWRPASSGAPSYSWSASPKAFYEEFQGSGDLDKCRARFVSPEFTLAGEYDFGEVTFTFNATRKSAELAPGSDDSGKCRDWAKRMRDDLHGGQATSFKFTRTNANTLVVNGTTTYFRQ
jgi:hypothetical protein